MEKIETEIVIETGAATVWRHLADFSSYPQWNPFITRIEGPLAEGARICFTAVIKGGRPATFYPVLTIVKPGQELRWVGKLGFSWIFQGEHIFKLEENGPGKTRLTHMEKFSGLLNATGLVDGMLRKTRDGFVQMNEALKTLCEGEGGTDGPSA
ncbi:MAG: SRPBCC domain-containing protein [Nitrospinota bacterium]|nr:SRPBCC domain-containing protein [Nitrospinota bacterium]